jgi:hypothetical protein
MLLFILYFWCGWFCLFNIIFELDTFTSQCDNFFFKILNLFFFLHHLNLHDFFCSLFFFKLDLQGVDFLFKFSLFLTKLFFNMI